MRLRVLIVDDDKESCEAIQAVMTASGLDAVAETSSSRAAEFLRKERYDAIFVDIHMPAPDGYALSKLIRGEGINRKTPIIMVTGDQRPEVLARGFEAGASFFLFKPFDRGRLMRVVRAAQGTIQQERRRFQRVKVNCPVKLVADGEQTQGTTVDISLQGLLVDARKVFPQGTRVEIQMVLNIGEKPLLAAGQVVRVIKENKMGIQLEGVSRAESERLQEFLLPLILKSLGE
jgi:CheY-like chemotaxis protein